MAEFYAAVLNLQAPGEDLDDELPDQKEQHRLLDGHAAEALSLAEIEFGL